MKQEQADSRIPVEILDAVMSTTWTWLIVPGVVGLYCTVQSNVLGDLAIRLGRPLLSSCAIDASYALPMCVP